MGNTTGVYRESGLTLEEVAEAAFAVQAEHPTLFSVRYEEGGIHFTFLGDGDECWSWWKGDKGTTRGRGIHGKWPHLEHWLLGFVRNRVALKLGALCWDEDGEYAPPYWGEVWEPKEDWHPTLASYVNDYVSYLPDPPKGWAQAKWENELRIYPNLPEKYLGVWEDR